MPRYRTYPVQNFRTVPPTGKANFKGNPKALLMNVNGSIYIVLVNVNTISDPARFRDIYNIIISRGQDIALLQETNITDEQAQYNAYTLRQVRYLNYKGPDRGGVGIIINNLTTKQGETQVVYRDAFSRLLVGQVVSKGVLLQVTTAYVLA